MSKIGEIKAKLMSLVWNRKIPLYVITSENGPTYTGRGWIWFFWKFLNPLPMAMAKNQGLCLWGGIEFQIRNMARKK